MRKAVCLTMVILFFLTVITGFAESRVHPGESGVHTFLAVLFVVSAFTHAVINRKVFFRYLSGRDKKPV
jgi:hypothetical protein